MDPPAERPTPPLTRQAIIFEELPPASHRMVAYDFGLKRNILRSLRRKGFAVDVPASTPADEVLALKPDGVFLSNGPGDPARTELRPRGSARTDRKAAALRNMSWPPGARASHGRKDIQTEVRPSRSQSARQRPSHRKGRHHLPEPRLCRGTRFTPKDLEVTHINLNDGTVAGLRHRETSIQRPISP